jgi:hypothetical protein
MNPDQPKARGAGSPTNASDAVDEVVLPPKPTVEEKVDAGVKETFPASDPVSVAHRSQQTVQPPPQPRRSPDWLLDKHR